MLDLQTILTVLELGNWRYAWLNLHPVYRDFLRHAKTCSACHNRLQDHIATKQAYKAHKEAGKVLSKVSKGAAR